MTDRKSKQRALTALGLVHVKAWIKAEGKPKVDAMEAEAAPVVAEYEQGNTPAVSTQRR